MGVGQCNPTVVLLGVQRVLQTLSGFERWHFRCFDRDRLSGPRIATRPRCTVAHLERAEARYLDPTSPPQLGGNNTARSEQCVDRTTRIGLGEVCTIGERFDQFDFVHPVPPAKVTDKATVI